MCRPSVCKKKATSMKDQCRGSKQRLCGVFEKRGGHCDWIEWPGPVPAEPDRQKGWQ